MAWQPGAGEARSDKARQQHGTRGDVWALILCTCSVTLGRHNLLLGDRERVSLTRGKKQRETSKNIKMRLVNIP